MNAEELSERIHRLGAVRTLESPGTVFFIYDAAGDLPDERLFPFATLVTDNSNDAVSGLDEPGTFRINVGLTKAEYRQRFGTPPTQRDEHGILDAGVDYAARDEVLPHPHYASHHWVCVVNPADKTSDDVHAMLERAHDFAARKYDNYRAREHTRVQATGEAPGLSTSD